MPAIAPAAAPIPTLAEATRQMRDGSLTSVELTQHCLDRIAEVDGAIKACVTVVGERALEQAAAADARFAAARAQSQRSREAALGRLHPLLGMPLGIKDLIETAGVLTTAGSRVLDDYIPDHDATVVRLLTEAGAFTLCKTNTHEFAYGTFTKPTRNPWDTDRIPGGSSGGSAAGLAAGMFPGALGTDTGGSIRIPAACCGVVGFKPTYGLVSRAGIIPLSWSYDHAGPLARTVEDCALLLNTLAGYDPDDPDSAEVPLLDYVAALAMNRTPEDAVRGMRLAIPTNEFLDGATPDVRKAFAEAVALFERLGAELHEITCPASLDDLFDVAYRGVQRPEAYTYHSEMGWTETRSDRYSPTVRANLESGKNYTARDYIQAQRRRRAFTADLRAAMAGTDALLTPTLPIPAPRADALDGPYEYDGKSKDAGYMLLRNTFAFDLTGQPALAVPCGFANDGLPISLQIVAARFDEPTVLRLGYAFERARG